MFTPPSSPLPPKRAHSPEPEDCGDENFKDGSSKSPQCPAAVKRAAARRTKWTVIMLPLALILLTLSTRYFGLTRGLAIFSSDFSVIDWQNWGSQRLVHARHRRASPTSAASPSPPAGSSVPQNLPPIPASAPTLPTPFPQPLDSSLTRNFSSQSCYNFFANMTSTPSFRSCRPFSLLLQSSKAFITAQNNITVLNNIIWGTCNTSPGQNQCTENMAWFLSALHSECEADVKDNNAVAVETMRALQAFPVLAKAACLPDPSTNAYCYIKAVVNANPSDLYFYSIPLGTKLPVTSSPSCSACTKSLMGLYATAMKTATLDGLIETYIGAAEFANKACGDGYAQTSVSKGVNGAWSSGRGALWSLFFAMVFSLAASTGVP